MTRGLLVLLAVYVFGVVAAGGALALLTRRLPGGRGDRALPALLARPAVALGLAAYWALLLAAVAALLA